MWSEQKRNRLDELREKAAEQGLTDVERAELEGLFAELDAEEALDLSPGMARVARETDALRAEKARVEERLRLNRPALVAHRQGLRERRLLREELASATERARMLEQQVNELGVAIDGAADEIENDGR